MTIREATCSCGGLKLKCEGDPVRISMCHCLECQRRTGSVFGVQAWFPTECVNLAGGVATQFARRGDSGRLVTFHFCPQCGGTVFWQAEQRPEFTAVAIGAFADPTFASPRVSFWESRKHLWIGAIGELEIERSQ